MRSKSARKNSPPGDAKAERYEKPSLAASVRMRWRQQIFANLPAINTSSGGIRQFHVAQSSDLEVRPLISHLPARMPACAERADRPRAGAVKHQIRQLLRALPARPRGQAHRLA